MDIKNKNKSNTLKIITLSAAVLTIAPFASVVAGNSNGHLHKASAYNYNSSFDNKESYVEWLSNRLEKLESKIDAFEADVKDGPNSKIDNMLKDKIDNFSERKEIVEEKIENLQDADDQSEWKRRKQVAVMSLNQLEQDYMSLSKKYKHIR